MKNKYFLNINFSLNAEKFRSGKYELIKCAV